MPREGPREDPVGGLLDDLEQQAAGLHLADRAVEVAELGIAQYAEVELAGRLHASAGRPVRVDTTDGWNVQGQLVRAGAGWIVLDVGGGREWALNVAAVATVGGLADGTLPPEARPISARLTLGSLLRHSDEGREGVAVRVAGGRVLHGRLARVGADFVELEQDAGGTTVIPFASLVAVQLRSGDTS